MPVHGGEYTNSRRSRVLCRIRDPGRTTGQEFPPPYTHARRVGTVRGARPPSVPRSIRRAASSLPLLHQLALPMEILDKVWETTSGWCIIAGIPGGITAMGRCPAGLVYIAAFCGVLNAQGSPRVDFQRDVQPILKANCTGCHGPTQQMNNFRLDRRRDAIRGGTISVIAPGSSQSSHLYLRLISRDTMGMPMPPTGSLPQAQIE